MGTMLAFLPSLALLTSFDSRDPPVEGMIRFTRLWVDNDGHTHLADCTVQGLKKSGSFGTPQYVRDMLKVLPPQDLIFTQQTGDNPWHQCPSPQLVVTLAGSWYIRTTDGGYVEMHAGDVLYQ